MDPETENRIEQAEAFIEAMKSPNTLPLEVINSLREALGIGNAIFYRSSTKGVTSENQAVDEGGSGTYSVLKPPDGWEERTAADGTTHYYPYWT